MPSPFPGMNPYLEQFDVWHDFHERFMPLVAALIESQVGPEYFVKIDEHVYVQEAPGDEWDLIGRGDIAIAERPGDGQERASRVALLDAPVRVHPRLVGETRDSFVEIRDRKSRKVVTVIELLSPSNKTGRDRGQYLKKRGDLLESPVHLVEIDLLRGGDPLPFEDLPQCDYYVMVSRPEERPGASLWPLSLRSRLPVAPVPLKPGDADVRLDLQDVIHQIHDAAGYAKYIYEGVPWPPLRSEDAVWARSLVPAR